MVDNLPLIGVISYIQSVIGQFFSRCRDEHRNMKLYIVMDSFDLNCCNQKKDRLRCLCELRSKQNK